ncbi:probable WRKY transcription factor 57 [Eucalyptus grandis]|uniref:probable WRKY transcription factor 57 n=1 Tax=Eucalyptus grandis TaxID=71139 RepID=UPI00192E9F71|nr:probable WRKY transcription factor 57 [Eucalyptus grandis]
METSTGPIRSRTSPPSPPGPTSGPTRTADTSSGASGTAPRSASSDGASRWEAAAAAAAAAEDRSEPATASGTSTRSSARARAGAGIGGGGIVVGAASSSSRFRRGLGRGRDRGGDASTSNRSASSESSEDPPERSAASGESLLAPEKPNKVRKKGQKRIKQPRFAFMTKSEVDHLEDGYRWRKYGQKAVKNSPYPRSYYRCTNSKCTVKKRVERSSEDPAIVVTTYEGQHCHHSAGYLRSSTISHEATFGRHFAYPPSQIYHPTRLHVPIETSPYNLNTHRAPTSSGDSQRLLTSSGERGEPSGVNQLLPTEGLLADVVPPKMR